MKALAGAIGILSLCGCATPKPFVDTATYVGKIATQMDAALDAYVATSNSLRGEDASRLAAMQTSTDRRTSATQDQLQIWSLQGNNAAAAMMKTLAGIGTAEPISFAQSTGTDSTGQSLAYDSKPLQSIAQAAGEIAAPKSSKDSALVLIKFAQQVNADLQKGTP